MQVTPACAPNVCPARRPFQGRGLAPSAVLSAIPLCSCTALTSLGGLTGGESSADAGPDSAQDPGTLTLSCDTSTGEKICFGACTSNRDPKVGCSASDCVACDPRNVDQAECAGAAEGFACSYRSCEPRYQDCDGDRRNGCESSKNNARACGDCATRCEGATPFCAPTGADFVCVASCPPGTQACDGACVTLASDRDNCGACGSACERAGAKGRCEAGACVFECQPGLKDCNGACVSVQDPRYCLACAPCPAASPGTMVSCSGGTCAVACLPNAFDGDGKPGNGCESPVACGAPQVDPCINLTCQDSCCPGIGCCSSMPSE